MKNLYPTKFSVLLLFGALSFAGCRKDPVVEPVKVIPAEYATPTKSTIYPILAYWGSKKTGQTVSVMSPTVEGEAFTESDALLVQQHVATTADAATAATYGLKQFRQWSPYGNSSFKNFESETWIDVGATKAILLSPNYNGRMGVVKVKFDATGGGFLIIGSVAFDLK